MSYCFGCIEICTELPLKMRMRVLLMQSDAEREWLIKHYEQHRYADLGVERKRAMAERLTKCQTLEQFITKKFGTVKKYGGEGAESMIPFFDELLLKCSKGI